MTAQLLIYESLVPVSPLRHGGASVEMRGDYSFARNVNAVPMLAVEFPNAAAEYSIVFAGDEVLMPTVILSMRAQENLYLSGDGVWQAKYIPAFVRRYPFVFSSRDDGATFTLCVDEAYKGFNRENHGQRLFTDDRKPTPFVEDVLRFLRQYQIEFQRTQAFCKKLKELNLFESMRAQVDLEGGTRMSLTGFMAVHRDRLKALAPEKLAELVKTGEIELLYLHLHSMRNFNSVRRPLDSGERVAALSEQISPSLDIGNRPLTSSGASLRPNEPALREVRVPSPAVSAQVLKEELARPLAPPDPVGDRGALLLKLVADLGVPYYHEHSFRMTQGSLQGNRFLLTVNKHDIPGDPCARGLAICKELAMPEAACRTAEEAFDSANCLHFGFEGNPESVICKLYLERTITKEEARRARERGEPIPLGLAFKWDILKNLHVVTRYMWHLALRAQQIEQRLAHVYRGNTSEAPVSIAKALLALAASRVAAEKLYYLEVQEDQNDRRSFDLNVYDARLQVKDTHQLLRAMREHFGVHPEQFQPLYDQIKTLSLGHLAGGVHRNGRDFFNVYYGAARFLPSNKRSG